MLIQLKGKYMMATKYNWKQFMGEFPSPMWNYITTKIMFRNSYIECVNNELIKKILKVDYLRGKPRSILPTLFQQAEKRIFYYLPLCLRHLP